MHNILLTKIHLPNPNNAPIYRGRLHHQLTAGLQSRLTIVVAPAGFGKSTIVSEWIQSQNVSASWLSLDTDDNEPTRFLQYVIACLQVMYPQFGQPIADALFNSPDVIPTGILTDLLNEMAAISGKTVIVLDDYHVINSQEIDRILSYLIDHIPPQVHWIIITRTEPNLSLSRRRVRDELSEIRAADLRFNQQEIQQYFETNTEISLDTDQQIRIGQRTEGWAAGIQLAALALKRVDDIEQFVRSFSGSHRYVMDYLTDEVLQQLGADETAFLLQTSILSELSAGLCNAVTEREDAQIVLERFENMNLFLIPLDDHRGTYRYHHLFADLLRQRLNQNIDMDANTLHRRAGGWYLQMGYLDEAIYHFMEGHDSQQASNLVIQYGQHQLNLGDYSRLGRWLERLPTDVKRGDYRLAALQAWIFYFASDLDTVAMWLEAAQHAFDQHVFDSEQTAATEHVIYFSLRVWVASQQGDLDRAVQIVEGARSTIPDNTHTVSAMYLSFLAEAQRRFGYLDEALETYEAAIEASQKHEVGLAIIGLVYAVATIHMTRGQLAAARDRLERVIDYAISINQDRHTAPARTLLLWITYEHNHLDIVQQHLPDVYERIKYQDARLGISYYLLAAKTAVQLASPAQALEAVEQVQAEMHHWTVSIETPTAEGYVMRLLNQLGQHDRVAHWVDRLDAIDEPVVWARMPIYLAATDALRIQNTEASRERAFHLTHALHKMCDSLGATGNRIDVLCLEALLFKQENALDKSLAAIKDALQFGEPDGYIRTFADYGQPMAALLREAVKAGIYPEYCHTLLKAIGETPGTDHAIEAAQSQLIEPLTDREIEILTLISTGATNQEIADTLVIAITTVKKHVTNLYGKLGVRHRAEAVHRARTLGFIP